MALTDILGELTQIRAQLATTQEQLAGLKVVTWLGLALEQVQAAPAGRVRVYGELHTNCG
jgi:hypothetical protein